MATREDPIPDSETQDGSYSYIPENENAEIRVYEAISPSEKSIKEGFETSHGRLSCVQGLRKNENRKKQLGNDSVLAVMCQWIVDHQIGEQGPAS